MPRSFVSCLGLFVGLFLGLAPAFGQQAGPDKFFDDRPPPLPKEVLSDSKLIARGEQIWKEQCAHCHGSKAYPGKAPKLTPRRYTPEFVWDRVNNGFRGMPAWKEVYSAEEIIGVVAYVMSDEFWP
ncbi:MAG: cytochrome c [Geminicoccaceae bacterium]|nr:cytochrome c [Geminicoccaceae bacterium]MCS7266717.1 cytochrome c [Geminicoccaceae bacterium]MCX7628634.1 cytochrome c [Geminicoccaceae bacterium]MDW8124415.1 cytochrome c [Geminicoccaceae bacterium]MDW8342673.1 cytochrome c [Geminicoccaceae bacterium]